MLCYSRVGQEARGVYMTQGNKYYLEAILYDKNYWESMALHVKIPGIDDVWKPVTNEMVERI